LKYTVITGASSGIGYASALTFAKRGKNVIIIARRKEKLVQLKNEIDKNSENIDVVIVSADLSITDQVYNLYQSLKKYDIETWINCAGLGDFSSIEKQNLQKIESILKLNIEAVTILSTLFVQDYANKENTTLINVSSAAGYIMISDFVTYVSAFTEGLAQELQLKKAKLKAKVLAPAITETEFELNSLEVDDFNYQEKTTKFHTSDEMAKFMLELYDSDKIVGIVDEESYKFILRDPLFLFRGFEK
jgi:short-subunit dehydrogenase